MSTTPISTSKAISNLGHILGTIVRGKTDNINKGLEFEGIDDVIDFINLPSHEFQDLEYPTTQGNQHLVRIEICLLTNIQAWCVFLYNTPNLDGWKILTIEDYEVFRRAAAADQSKPDPVVSSEVKEVSPPTKNNNTGQPSLSFLSNVKLDLKSFPTFDGKKEH